ncbi:hypothetical protein DVH24_017789 [Malus domestica]|uniref:Uncharacterized protein n=1 Tax=Malus domestica TaxID=3750 RepID=A0A498KEF4_MALDO|nr:hypothetical protein DVH24_017789 [Malus domestica]
MGIEDYPSRPLQAALKIQFEEGEKTVSSQYLGNQLLDASPIKAGLADENPKEEETDAFASQSEWRYRLIECNVQC